MITEQMDGCFSLCVSNKSLTSFPSLSCLLSKREVKRFVASLLCASSCVFYVMLLWRQSFTAKKKAQEAVCILVKALTALSDIASHH